MCRTVVSQDQVVQAHSLYIGQLLYEKNTQLAVVGVNCAMPYPIFGACIFFAVVDGDEQSEDVQEKETPITSKSESEKILIDNLLQEQLCESQDATDSPLILSEEQEFMVILATCNTVAVAHTSSENQVSNVDCDFTDSGNTEGEEIVYEAENPDEAALVNAAKAYGVTLQSRTLDSLTVDLLGFGCRKYQLLHVLSFTSERKRMSVILQNSLTQEIVLYCKGADSVIYNLLKREAFYPPSIDRSSARMPRQKSTEALAEVTQRHLDGFARLGLRTLCIAKRVGDIYLSVRDIGCNCVVH